jgi:hypothetical protein
MQIAYFLLSRLVWLDYVFTYLLKRRDFRKDVEHKMCLLTSLQHLSENFVILRRTERDTIISIHRSSCKVPVILVRFYGNVNLIDRVSIFLLYQISWKSVSWEPSFSMRSDRCDETNGRFSQLWALLIKTRLVRIFPRILHVDYELVI